MLADCAGNMVHKGSALSTIAPRPYRTEVGVANMAVAARKCARWKAAARLHTHVMYVLSIVHTKRASSMAAPPTRNQDLNIAV